MNAEQILQDIKEHPVAHIHNRRALLGCCTLGGVVDEELFNAHFKYVDLGINPSEKCDNPDGPCACGAWHNPEEMIRKFLKK